MSGAAIRNRLGGVADYFFGRNATIGIASLMLLALSGYATWSGMNDFIVGSSSQSDREFLGGLSAELLVIAVVVALTFLMWLALRETFRTRQPLLTRAITLPLYLFLALWSVGFGYGFWWSLIAGEQATTTSMANLNEDARVAATSIADRLSAVQSQLDAVVEASDGKMRLEARSGGSCDGTTSRPGRGELYKARESVRDRVAALRQRIDTTWLVPVDRELARLRTLTATVAGDTVEARERSFDRQARRVRETAEGLASRSNALGVSNAAQMRLLADSLDPTSKGPKGACLDSELAALLRRAADQAEVPVRLELREASFTEGPAGVANAVKSLWSNLGAYFGAVLGYILSGGGDPNTQTAGGQPITGRALIALLATLGIDLGLFVLTALNPPLVPASRTDGLSAPVSKLRLPSGAVVRQLASAISTAIARAPDVDLEWVRQHFVHHAGSSYFVIPNLYSVSEDKDEQKRALAINQLAGVFDDVDLVRALTEEEFKKFGEEEERASFTDLDRYRAEYKEAKAGSAEGERPARPGIRNHGLLSKSQRALDIAGWSKQAQRDVEIFRLTDVEGLTPLLTLLSEATLEKGARAAEAAVRREYKERTGEFPPEPAFTDGMLIAEEPDLPNEPDTFDSVGTEVDSRRS